MEKMTNNFPLSLNNCQIFLINFLKVREGRIKLENIYHCIFIEFIHNHHLILAPEKKKKKKKIFLI